MKRVPHFVDFKSACRFHASKTPRQVIGLWNIGNFRIGVPPLEDGQRAELLPSGLYSIQGDCRHRGRTAAAPNIGRPYSDRTRRAPSR
jgi:hypothetical protein